MFTVVVAYTVSFTALNSSTGWEACSVSVVSDSVSSAASFGSSSEEVSSASAFADGCSTVGASTLSSCVSVSCTVSTFSVETVFSVLSSAAVVSLEQPNMETAKIKANAATMMLLGVSFFFKVDSSSFCLFVSIAPFPVVDKGGIHYRDGAAARHGWGLGGCE